MRLLLIIGLVLNISIGSAAQSPAHDTIIVQLAGSSTLTLSIGDPQDIKLLRHYDFQALMDDMLSRLGEVHGISQEEETIYELYGDDHDKMETDQFDMEPDDDFDEGEADDESEDFKAIRHKFFGSTNFDLGINNYHSSKGLSPEGSQYTVRPWGSWYAAITTTFNTRVNDKFLVEWGVGFNFYNFKFQDDRTILTEGSDAVVFSTDQRNYDFIKSKLAVSYINLSALPTLEFGAYRDESKCWKPHRRMFRIGAGLYAGYRIGSNTKQVYEIDEVRKRERHRDNFYLNNIRYGARLQFGIMDTDFFINYDLNPLFAGNRGPQLNAYSFGITF